MQNPVRRKYLYLMLSGFGAISLSVLFFFVLYRFQGLGEMIGEVLDILNPFIYGGVIAYLLRPVCNWYEAKLDKYLPKKLKKAANALAVTLSMLTGLLAVYALIIMIAPNLYTSIQNIWVTLPDRVNAFLSWAYATFGEDEKILELVNMAYKTLYSNIDTWAKETLMPYVTNIVSGVGYSVVWVLRFMMDLLIGLIVAVYLLGSRKKFKKQAVMVVRGLLPQKWAEIVLDESAFVEKMFGVFID